MKMSLRVNIVLHFVFLILLITGLLLWIQHKSSTQIATQAIDKTFQTVSQNIHSFIDRSEKVTKKVLTILSYNGDISDSLYSVEKDNIINDFVAVLNNSKYISSIYIGYGNGEFYKLINLINNKEVIAKHGAPQKSRWALLTIKKRDGLSKTKIKFFDTNLYPLFEKELTINFDPTQRPWFKKALNSSDAVLTDIYTFKSNNKRGMTYAKATVNKKAVIGLDLTLLDLHNTIKRHSFDKESRIFLYTKKGVLLASSSNNTVIKWDSLFQYIKNSTSNTRLDYIYNSKEYYIYHTLYSHKKSENHHLFLGITMPKEKLMQPYLKQILNSFYIALAFIFFSLPLVFLLASFITKPIRILMLENEKIKNRKFNQVSPIKTHIAEFIELSDSLVRMSQSIQEYQKSQEELLNSIIQIIAQAIDTKSSYTGGHCNRVPEIATMLTQEASKSTEGIFKEFSFKSEDEWREFKIGAWLHDCGKVTTPEYVVDKSTKLETIYNRIHEIRTRFEVLHRDSQIEYLESQLKGEDKEKALSKMNETQQKLIEEFKFLASSNIGGEFMSPDKQERIKSIASREWTRYFDDRLGLSDAELLRYEDIADKQTPAQERLLCDKQEHIIKREHFDYDGYKKDGFKEEVPEYLYNYGEVYNLCIAKGTLTPEERFKINAHVIMTIKMLEQIPFPKELTRIPEYAGTHHETMIGTGYPRKLSKKDLSIPSRIMALADIYEALTASDRPYKKAKTISEAIKIMSFMVKDEHIDRDIFELFLKSGVYLQYAQEHLNPEQIDEVNIEQFT